MPFIQFCNRLDAKLSISLLQNFKIFQSIFSYNGGAVVAMKGKNCVAIAADRRFGIQMQTITTDFQVSTYFNDNSIAKTLDSLVPIDL